MSELKKIGFGAVDDTSEDLKGKGSSILFGLNSGAKITKFEYNPNAGKDGTPADAIDIWVTVGTQEVRNRIYDVTRVKDSNGQQILDENSDEYISAYNTEMVQNQAVVIHALKSLKVTQSAINAALQVPVADFASWAKVVTALLPNNFKDMFIDVFLEYQWKIPQGKDRTYLTLPKNMKGGYFMSPPVVHNGSWTAQTEWEDEEGAQHEGLRYVDDNGVVHPFVRTKNYMESNKGVQQRDTPSTNISLESTGSTSTSGIW